jgi:HSP20 family protein
MDFKKLAPWNWFKDEENETGSQIAVSHGGQKHTPGQVSDPLHMLHRDMNDLLGRFLHGYGDPLNRMENLFPGSLSDRLLKPMVDISANDKEYTISIEVPGIEQDDIKLEIHNNTLTVKGEKRQEKEEKKKDYYRMERSYGAFQRVLSLPEDADQDKVAATFKNGVLSVNVPRKALQKTDIKQIEIK